MPRFTFLHCARGLLMARVAARVALQVAFCGFGVCVCFVFFVLGGFGAFRVLCLQPVK